jgi:hypothetical protein
MFCIFLTDSTQISCFEVFLVWNCRGRLEVNGSPNGGMVEAAYSTEARDVAFQSTNFFPWEQGRVVESSIFSKTTNTWDSFTNQTPWGKCATVYIIFIAFGIILNGTEWLYWVW